MLRLSSRRSLAHASKMLFKYLKEPQGDDQSIFVFLGSSFLFCLPVWTNSLEEVAYESVKLF
jgi:hypothetical protein